MRYKRNKLTNLRKPRPVSEATYYKNKTLSCFNSPLQKNLPLSNKGEIEIYIYTQNSLRQEIQEENLRNWKIQSLFWIPKPDTVVRYWLTLPFKHVCFYLFYHCIVQFVELRLDLLQVSFESLGVICLCRLFIRIKDDL